MTCWCHADITGSAHSHGWLHSLQISVIVAVAVESLFRSPFPSGGGYFKGEVFMGIIILDSMCWMRGTVGWQGTDSAKVFCVVDFFLCKQVSSWHILESGYGYMHCSDPVTVKIPVLIWFTPFFRFFLGAWQNFEVINNTDQFPLCLAF